MQKRGKLIVIDGADGSGKKTQTQLLVEALREKGYSVQQIDFPQRENFFGSFIYRCLEERECGDFSAVHPKIASVLYAADRAIVGPQINTWLDEGNIVIADRYVSANQIHQGGKITNPKEREQYLEWLDQMEYGEFKIPRPDRVFYLDVPHAVSVKLIEDRKKKEQGDEKLKRRATDQHELSTEHQIAARESAIKMLTNITWRRIMCSDDGETILTREMIHARVMEHCQDIL